MTSAALVSDLANIIGLAVAPVFLLAAIAGFLSVMSGRLGRIIDRARIVEQRVLRLTTGEQCLKSKAELKILWSRVTIINWSIGLCTTSALLVCSVIAILFVGALWELQVESGVIGLFILALSLLISALLLFLKEVYLATYNLRIGVEWLDEAGSGGH